MPAFKTLVRFTLGLAAIGLMGSTARADDLFIGSQAGLCCFNVDLTQIDANDMQVTVSLTGGAKFFVDTGSGQHPGFAFSLAGDPAITVSNISSPWTSADFHATSVTTGGPSLGTFDYFFDDPGSGGSAMNSGPLVFTITDPGITFASFVTSTGSGGGFFFAADIMNSDGATGLSGISTPGTTTFSGPPVPEPTSFILIGTGLVSMAGVIRRRAFTTANNK